MKRRARHRLGWLGSSCLVLLGCTQLEDPNQSFASAGAAGGLSSGGAAAGQLGAGGAGSSGVGGSIALTAGSAGVAGQHAMAGDGGAPDTDCVDEGAFHGLGCYRCAPTDISTLENACTSATCTRFDDAKRLTLLGKDGKLPPLPVGSGGAGGSAGSAGAGGSAGAPGGSAGASGGTAGAPGTGKACADLATKPGNTVVYITGSSAAKPFLEQVAQQLVDQKIYIVYESTGSCVGVDAVVNGTPMTTGPAAPALSATYWDSSASTGVACDLPAEGVKADIGASDVFAQSCAGFELAPLDSVRDAHGPIQTMTFAVPTNSPHYEISAEAAYFAFGFGASGGVHDAAGTVIWNDETYLFKRSATSGTQVMLAAAIGVPAGVWKGKGNKGSDDVALALQTAGKKQETGNAALGILAADYIITKNLSSTVRVLAFQDSAQHCAVYPDSTLDARDKLNVRDGHYPIWGPLHLLLRLDAQGNPGNTQNRQAVTDIVGYLSGTKALPNGVQLLKLYANSGLVPECAMHVTRSKDGGNIFPFKPPSPCSCLFDVKATGSTSCTPCTVQADCAGGETCSLGYCEPQ